MDEWAVRDKQETAEREREKEYSVSTISSGWVEEDTQELKIMKPLNMGCERTKDLL